MRAAALAHWSWNDVCGMRAVCVTESVLAMKMCGLRAHDSSSGPRSRPWQHTDRSGAAAQQKIVRADRSAWPTIRFDSARARPLPRFSAHSASLQCGPLVDGALRENRARLRPLRAKQRWRRRAAVRRASCQRTPRHAT